MTRIVGVNGILTHGEGNIDVLLERLRERGLTTVDIKLPKRSFISARWGGSADGKLIALRSFNSDILVAHSFGCLRAWHAHQTNSYKAIFCIAPAMSDSVVWRYPDRVFCYCSMNDLAVRIGSLLAFHPFGTAGLRGFTQQGVVNVRCESSHGGYFKGRLLMSIVDHVEKIAKS